jgi:hypothetical protein
MPSMKLDCKNRSELAASYGVEVRMAMTNAFVCGPLPCAKLRMNYKASNVKTHREVSAPRFSA